jgi:hypothetical protein
MENSSIIAEKFISPAPLTFEVRYLQEQIIKAKPMQFDVFQQGKGKSLISNDFTHTWALANFFTADTIGGDNTNDRNVEKEEQQEIEDQQCQTGDHNDQNNDNSILSVKTRIRKCEKYAKEEVMPTCAATKSLLFHVTVRRTHSQR